MNALPSMITDAKRLNNMCWRWMIVLALAAYVTGLDKIPHPTRCNMYYQLDTCSPDLHFNAQTQKCDLPSRANCNTECSSLVGGTGMEIKPTTCITGSTQLGGSCKFSCAKGYQLKGTDNVICTKSGWNSTEGLNIIPTCMTPEQLVTDVVTKVDEELKGVNASLLFLLDESTSITRSNFPKEVRFIKALVSAFPLSQTRSAGVILFTDKAKIQISIRINDTCTFLKKADKISYHGGGTNIHLALKTANQEISSNSIHKKNIVLLITDGQSADPTSEANILKGNGNILFTIGVAGYDRKILQSIASDAKEGGKLFYGITDFAAFDAVASHLETEYRNGTQNNCP